MQTCPRCGTEVDDDAAFCPSCGLSLTAPRQTPAAPPPPVAGPPPAPAWHGDEDEAIGHTAPAWTRRDELEEPADPRAASIVPPIASEAPPPPVEETPPRMEEPPAPFDEPRAPSSVPPSVPPVGPPVPPLAPPVPPPSPAAAQPPGPLTAEPAPAERGGGGQLDLPLTLPVTISGWLVGGGALVGALALFVDFSLFRNPVTIVLLVLLLGVAATVFLSTKLPGIPYLQLGVMATIFAGLGVALDRVGFGSIVGIGSAILLLAMIAAATGVIIAETGRDRPWAGPGQG